MRQAKPTKAKGALRPILRGAGALIAFTIGAALFARASGMGDVHMPKSEPYQVLRLDVLDASDGGVLVRDASDGAMLYRVAPGTNGFLRGAMRGFAQERVREGIGPDSPFTLTRWRDGTLSLQDEATGRRIDLDAFGPAQAQDFAQLFAARETAK